MSLYREHLQPRLLDLALRSAATDVIRDRVCAGLQGEVVEIGYGSGLNQSHLPPEVSRVTALEPSRLALRLATRRRLASPVPVVVAGGDAQRMPLPDDCFDAALSTWTLCGIPDPVAALREVRRVLRPGGTLHFVEHGLAPDADVARKQGRGNAVNRWLAGCELDRDIEAALAASGLQMQTMRTYYQEHISKASGFFYEGTARSVS